MPDPALSRETRAFWRGPRAFFLALAQSARSCFFALFGVGRILGALWQIWSIFRAFGQVFGENLSFLATLRGKNCPKCCNFQRFWGSRFFWRFFRISPCFSAKIIWHHCPEKRDKKHKKVWSREKEKVERESCGQAPWAINSSPFVLIQTWAGEV